MMRNELKKMKNNALLSLQKRRAEVKGRR